MSLASSLGKRLSFLLLLRDFVGFWKTTGAAGRLSQQFWNFGERQRREREKEKKLVKLIREKAKGLKESKKG